MPTPETTPLSAVEDAERPFSPWREVGLAILVLVLCFGLGVLAWFVAMTVLRHTVGIPRQGINRTFGPLLASMAMEAGWLAVIFLRARTLGAGSVIGGLALGPAGRSRLFLGWLLLQIAVTAFYVVSIARSPEFAESIQGDLHRNLVLAAGQIRPLLICYLLNFTLVLPVLEELFFRGWLWTALRRRWGPWRTGLCTATIWWAIHGVTYGPWQMISLLPSALVFSLVRHFTGSCRPTIILHIINNSKIAIITLMALAWR